VAEVEELEAALETLGALLEERGQTVGVLVAGGASLLLLGLVRRPTADIDVVGFVGPVGYLKADELPAFLATAVAEVGDALGLGDRWLNGGPAGLLDLGLPAGLETRVTVRHYAALEVHLPAREDLVCFKLYAAVDQGPRSKHHADLVAMNPTPDELVSAASWSRTQDPSAGFLAELRRTVAFFAVELDDGDG
jgi:hypothetical protein